MVRPIIQLGDKRLLQTSSPLSKEEIFSRETDRLIEDMIDTCNQDKAGTGGLSAVQIGELKRVFVLNRMDLPGSSPENPIWEVVINPQLEIVGKEKSTAWEGCLSVGEGDTRLFGPVERSDNVVLTYLDREGREQRLEANGYFAHVVQHEQDHLNGALFLRYIKNPVNIWQSKELDEYLDEHGEFPEVL